MAGSEQGVNHVPWEIGCEYRKGGLVCVFSSENLKRSHWPLSEVFHKSKNGICKQGKQRHFLFLSSMFMAYFINRLMTKTYLNPIQVSHFTKAQNVGSLPEQ